MPNRKKIFYLITKSNWGGAQRYVYDLATNLSKSEFEVLVIFGEGGEMEKKLKSAQISTLKIEGLGRNVNPVNDWKVFWRLVNILKQEKPDIVHLNSSKIGILGALAGRLAKIPKIFFTAHAWAFNEKRPDWQRMTIKFLHWLTVLLCHKTIAVSERTKDQMARLPFLKDKFTVIHNGLDEWELLSRENARQELGKKIWKDDFDPEQLNKTLIIGSVAELHRNKGLDSLVLAASQMKDRLDNALFWIIGDGEEKDNLKQLIKEKKLKDHFVLFGKIDEAKKYLKAFDIFVLPSRTEALPYSVLEAGRAGLPIIASSVGGLPEIISDFRLGILVRPSNAKEIKLALTRLFDNPAERTEFGKNIAKKINKEFTVEKMAKETTKLYKK